MPRPSPRPALSTVVGLALLGLLRPVEGLAQQLRLERLWTAGSPLGSEAETWVRLEDATVVGDHVIAVDLLLPTVRVFTVAGDHVGDVGRVGSGPGEFARPISVRADPEGFEVWDLTQLRSVRWRITADGIEHERTTLEARLSFMTWLRPVRGGGRVGWTGLVSSRGELGETEVRHFVVHATDTRLDTVAAYDGNPLRIQFEGHGHEGPKVLSSTSPFAAGGAWLLGDSLLVVVDGWNSEGRVYRMEEAGPVLARTVALPTGAPARSIEDEDLSAIQRWYLNRVGLDTLEGTIADAVLPPERTSVWSWATGDDRGDIWLREGSVERLTTEGGERWLRWSLDDDTFTWLDVPRGVEVFRLRGGYLVGRELGEFGTHRLVVYRLVEA